MSDRRPLGTGTDHVTTPRTPDAEPVPAPRARLAAERLPSGPAVLAGPEPRPTVGRRPLLQPAPKPFQAAEPARPGLARWLRRLLGQSTRHSAHAHLLSSRFAGDSTVE